jgi:hypothetical protein
VASLRKRYRERQEFSSARSDAPVASTPRQANLPPISNAAPPEPVPVNAVEEAAAQSIKERLAEQQRAEQHRAAPSPQQPPFASEPQQHDDPIEANIAAAAIPERMKQWLRQHPEYVADQRKLDALKHNHWLARDEAGSEYSTEYFEALERLLGLRAPRQAPPIAAPQRQAPGPPVSAPPTRSAQSWSSGRPQQSVPSLTAEEAELAKTIGISPQEYQQQKRRMYELKPELRPRS